jgi:hypothetical protein
MVTLIRGVILAKKLTGSLVSEGNAPKSSDGWEAGDWLEAHGLESAG